MLLRHIPLEFTSWEAHFPWCSGCPRNQSWARKSVATLWTFSVTTTWPPGLTGTSNSQGLLLLLLSRFSCVWFCVTPSFAAHQAPPPMGFSRQEHRSGFPFPSPMHESEKWKWSHSVVSDSSQPHGLQPTRPLQPWDFPGKSTRVGCHCLLRHKA